MHIAPSATDIHTRAEILDEISCPFVPLNLILPGSFEVVDT